MKNISKEYFLKALNKSHNKTQLMRNLGYNGGYKMSQIREWESIFKLNIDEEIIKNNKKTYVCKYCGKSFTEKYSKWSNGDFCSKSCALKYSSQTNRKNTNEKISHSLKIKSIINYNNNPKLCSVCGKTIPYNRRKNKTCCLECRYKLASLMMKKHNVYNIGGYVPFSCKGHHGYYKGIYCDSTYELAYLIYCLDHNIDIKRCIESFEYELDGKKHKYHPDFVVDGIIIEIKNYHRTLNDIKLKCVNKPIKILYYEDLIPCFEYVSKKYNKRWNGKRNNFYDLYDKNSDHNSKVE